MKMEKFDVNIYYSGFCSYQIEAENEINAILIARKLPIKQNDILDNLNHWFEADEAILK